MSELFLLFSQLQQLLEEERAALLGGGPDRITAVAERKRALADLIEAAAARPGAAPGIDALARAARYNRDNAVICSAMLRHLTQALDKLRRHELHRSYRSDGSERSPPAGHTLGAA